MAITADKIGLSPDLTKALGDIGSGQQTAITGAYAKKKNQLLADARPGSASILAPGSYASERLGTGEALSTGGMKSGLEGVLGNTGYTDWKSQRDYQQNMELAKRIGGLMAPSTLEQVLGGLGGGAQAGGQFMGLYQSMKRPPTASGYGTASSSGAGASGYDPNFGYYYE